MFDSGGWMPYFAVMAIAYTAFVFIGESINPFKIRKDESHRRRKLAKSLALIFFIITSIAMMVEPYLGLSRSQLVLAVAALCTVFALKPLFKFFRFTRRTISPSVKQQADEPVIVTPSPTIAAEATVEAESALTISLSSAQQVSLAAQDMAVLDQSDTTPEQPTISISEEHQLELEISASNQESDFDDLDQTIAEADFIDADLTISETSEIAQPDQSTYGDDVESESADLSKEGSEEPSEAKPSDPTETLLQMLDKQNDKIKHFAKNNKSLVKDRETLTNEVSELKFSLQKVNTIARKGIAQRDQAIKLKNSALTLAAMEVKRRKLTEIKARKALMKMSNSLKTLTDQSTG